jgi:hypothetical protein
MRKVLTGYYAYDKQGYYFDETRFTHSSFKADTKYRGALITGELYKGDGAASWTYKFTDESSSKFKEVETDLCNHVGSAFQKEFSIGLHSCSLRKIMEHPLRATVNVECEKVLMAELGISHARMQSFLESYFTSTKSGYYFGKSINVRDNTIINKASMLTVLFALVTVAINGRL